ncbi:uncharacterized protein LOC134282554 [Saccostrea cucullata]|uniref:uncharacterized protein LOC134282554 n=1 Tax=Saccostrea cuccullata TaxID=36930 RepID=UPI002ED29EEA
MKLKQSAAPIFLKGCPKEPYDSNEIYKYPACLEINPQKRCYLANENCLNETSQGIPNSTIFTLPNDSPSYITSTDNFNLSSVLPNSTSNLQPGIESTHLIAGVVSSLSALSLVVVFVIVLSFYWKKCSRSWNTTVNSTDLDVIGIQRQEKNKGNDLELLLDFVSRQLSFADFPFVSTYLGELQFAETTYIDGNPSETYCKLFHVWRCKYPRIDRKAKLKEVFSSMERQDLIEKMEMFSKDIYCYKEALVNPTEQAQSSDFIIMSQNLAMRSNHVLRFLGLKQSDIDQIKTDNRTTREKILRALSKIQKDRPSLTRQSICNALYYADHSDVIDMLNSGWKSAAKSIAKKGDKKRWMPLVFEDVTHSDTTPIEGIEDIQETDISSISEETDYSDQEYESEKLSIQDFGSALLSVKSAVTLC